jgi:arylsulfatase A-like enzyme
MPTLCEAIGLTLPSGLDGQSLWPSLSHPHTPKPDDQQRKPMVWVFPEYGGQVAVRMGHFKVVRQRLKSKEPGPWEVYDLSTDPGEEHDLSATKGDIVQSAIEVLRREVDENAVFPLDLKL